MKNIKSVKESFEIINKVALITGGAGLLGEKHAQVIAEYGGIPILLDINEEIGKKNSRDISEKYQISSEFVKCDITNETQIERVRDKVLHKYGQIDILINNAAIDPKVEIANELNLSRLEHLSLDQWDLELSVGLTGSMLCSKIFGYEMAKKNSGVILNISSDIGIIAPDQRIYRKEGLLNSEQPVKPVTYSVIKHGLIGLTKYLSTYWNDKGVRVNSISPGGIYTNQDPAFVKKLTELIPLGRMAKEDDYKAAVIFLVSDASCYMTGANVVIDGGRSVW